MENAQLISLSRQIALQRQMDVVANNMANINTTGFKSENILFEDYLMPKARDNDFGGLDHDLHYTEDWATTHDMSTGSIEQTGNPLDVALSGDSDAAHLVSRLAELGNPFAQEWVYVPRAVGFH